MKNRRLVLCILTLVLMLTSCVSLADAVWPKGDVTFYVPAGAGGSTDTIARQFAERMKAITGKNFIVVNDTTGANSVAYEMVRNAKADGSTLMVYHGGICSQYASGQYSHSLDEFTVISGLTTADQFGYGLWVDGDAQWNTFDDFIAYAKDHPNELVCGVDTNNTCHMLANMLMERFGVQLRLVSAGSNAEKLPLLMGGNIDVTPLNPAGLTDYHNSGELKCLALFGSVRSELMPDVPCFAELGYETMMLPMFMFIAGPANIPQEIVDAIDDVVEEISKDESIYQVFANYGMDWTYAPTSEVQANAAEMQANYVEAFSLMK